MTITSKNQSLEETVTQIIKEEKPNDTKQLILLIEKRLQIPEKEALKIIEHLMNQGKIKLEQIQKEPIPFASYLKSNQAAWFWATIVLLMSTLICVFLISENFYPWSCLRYVFGVIFVLWLPGFSFVKAIFPIDVPLKTTSKDLDKIEKIALSIGLSLSIVPLFSLILYYTGLGINLTPLVLSLSIWVFFFAAIALGREYQAKNKGTTYFGV